jgi:membrane associated rhomboid family serine protease
VTNRFLLYPLLLITGLQLGPLLARDWRWHAGVIAQLFIVMVAGSVALALESMAWVVGAWTLLLVFVVAPRWLAGEAARQMTQRAWKHAATAWRSAGWLTWGEPGRVYRTYAGTLTAWARGDRADAEQRLRQLIVPGIPVTVRGAAQAWLLELLVAGEEWAAAVELYENVADWGALPAVAQARLLAARAYAENGQVETALRCLQFVVLSPRTVGEQARQLQATRVMVAALAGDEVEMEALLPGCRSEFAVTWRGRCAQVKATGIATATLPGYQLGQEALRMADQHAAPWRALWDREVPRGLTRALLVVLAVVFAAGRFVDPPLWTWLGNDLAAVHAGEWWRLWSALFLHANELHLVMNAVGLWMFGAAVERAAGAWRMLLTFVVAGVIGNWWSTWLGHYDVSVGASGGIFGLLGAFGVLVYRLDSPWYASARRRLLTLLLLLAATDFLIGWLEPQVDNLAHVGGFLAGIGMMLPQKRGQPGRASL